MTLDNNNTTPIDYTNEIWKDIPGYEGYYQVSDYGRVKSMGRIKSNQYNEFRIGGRILKPRKSSKGYVSVALYRSGKPKHHSIHGLVLEAFDRPREPGEQCNHLDCNKGNNKFNNLEWVTQSENMRHAFDNDLIPIRRGVKNNKAKLTPADIVRIRNEYKKGIRGNGAQCLANKYGVSKPAIFNIINRRTWKHID